MMLFAVPLILLAFLVNKSNSQTTLVATTTPECPFVKTTTLYPTDATKPPVTQNPTTTAWSLAYSTDAAKNSTVGTDAGTTYAPVDVYGFRMVVGKRCQFDAYLFPFRYLTEPIVCANWCRKEPSCLGFMASIYSGACEAFTKCTEIDDPDWVVYYRVATPTTTRFWAGTSPTPDNFIDLKLVTNVASLPSLIQSHFAQYGNVLQTVFDAANGSNSSTSGGDKYPLTRLSMSQSIVFQRTLEMAWKARVIFAYQPVEGWVADVPPQPMEGSQPNSTTRGSGRKYKCNQGTVDAACRLLKLNNEGIVFLLPWLWESFHNKSLPKSPAPESVSPLYTIVALCYGEAPPTFNNDLVCPDPAMLKSIASLALSVFQTYSEPLYVATIIGSPSYENEDGLPSVTHYYGSGVDFLCGVAVYGPSERGFDESCQLMARRLRKPDHVRDEFPRLNLATACDDVYVPAREENVGCGRPFWPIPTVHCDKTIIGSKR